MRKLDGSREYLKRFSSFRNNSMRPSYPQVGVLFPLKETYS